LFQNITGRSTEQELNSEAYLPSNTSIYNKTRGKDKGKVSHALN